MEAGSSGRSDRQPRQGHRRAAARLVAERARDDLTRARLVRDLAIGGWHEMTPAEATAAGAAAAVPAPNERPPRITAHKSARSADRLLAAHQVLIDLAREAGWGEVAFDYTRKGDTHGVYVTLTPTGRVLGAGARGGHRQVHKDVAHEVLRLQTQEGFGAPRIAERLNALAKRGAKKWQPPRAQQRGTTGKWNISTVQAIMNSAYYERLKAEAEANS